MGLLDMMGLGDTRFGQAVANNRSALGAFGAGLAGGTNLGEGLALATKNMYLARALDDERNKERSDEQKRQAQINQTRAWMQKMAQSDPYYADLMQAVDAGMPLSEAWGNAMSRQYPAAPKPTDDLREYDAAVKQGFPGTFMDYQTAIRQAGATNVTVGGGKYGTIPPGYQLVEGPDGARLELIPGGPAAQEAAAAEEAAANAQRNRTVQADIVTEDIDRALGIVSNASIPVTGVGAMASGIPGTPAHDLSNLVNTIKANVGFDKLQAMRDASPTGGALGQVSEKENVLLQSVLGALEQSQSKAQFEYNLKRLRSVYMKIVHGIDDGSQSVTSPEATGGAPGWQDMGNGIRIREIP